MIPGIHLVSMSDIPRSLFWCTTDLFVCRAFNNCDGSDDPHLQANGNTSLTERFVRLWSLTFVTHITTVQA